MGEQKVSKVILYIQTIKNKYKSIGLFRVWICQYCKDDEKKLHVSLGEVLIGRPSNLGEPSLLFFGGIFVNILWSCFNLSHVNPCQYTNQVDNTCMHIIIF